MMFNWRRKNNDTQDELLSQIKEVNQKLEQVINENKQLHVRVKTLQEQIETKDYQLSELHRKNKVFNGLLLSDEQSAVVDLLEYTDNCYFITGKAGTGKSTILKYFVKNTRKKVVALAPTGIAANIIEGRTIHSFFGLSPSLQDVNDPEAVHHGINAEPKLVEELNAIIIDEASMVRADVMDMIDQKLRIAKEKDSPYGGVQGQTFEHATIDYKATGAFAPGQTYVALSRCRRLEDIHLSAPLYVQDIIVSHEAMDYMKNNAVSALEYAKKNLSL